MGTTWPPGAVIADRAAGTVLTSAAADSLGAPHEFGGALPASTPLEMTGGGAFGWKPGEWTDDTQMALCLLTPLAKGDKSIGGVEDQFLRWYEGRPADVGSQTRAVLSQGRPLADSARRHHEAYPNNSAGNGGLMRIAPAALSTPGDRAGVADYAAATTALTHADPDCLDASVLWALAVDLAIHTAPPSDVQWDFATAVEAGIEHLAPNRRDRWQALIDEACAETPSKFTNNGWVIHAFQAALSAIVQTPIPGGGAPCQHLIAAIETAIRAGGDTDTVGAIAGALLGARWGATAIPFRWRLTLRGRHVGQEAELDAEDLDTLSRRAFGGGRGDSQGWPGCPALVPYYLHQFDPGPSPVDLGGVRFGGVGGLGAALKDGADVVVSLCRMGAQDVPSHVEHHVVGLIDRPDNNPNLAFVLAEVSDLIASRAAAGRSLYVHCVAAENRTPAVAATFLARERGVSVAESLDKVKRALGRNPGSYLIEGIEAAAALPRRNEDSN